MTQHCTLLRKDLIPVQILHMVNNSNTVTASLRDAVLQILWVALSYKGFHGQCLGMYVGTTQGMYSMISCVVNQVVE